MKRIASGLVVAAAVVAFAGPAVAQPSLDFHIQFGTFNCDAIGTTVTGCGTINPNFQAGMNQAVLVMGGIPAGAGAVQMGVEYASAVGAFIGAAQNCAGSYQLVSLNGPNGPWPSSGSGAAIAFGACIAPIGADGLIPIQFFFYGSVAASGTMSYIPDPAEGAIKYVDCDDVTVNIDPSNTGMADFGGTAGVVSCDGPVPTEEKSWGQIKSLF
jgi:hypothetical protein